MVTRAEALAVPRRTRPCPPAARPVSNARLAMIALMAGESMFFAGLVGAYLVFRLAAPVWPPAGQPRLPLAMTVLNTLVLFASVVPATRALVALRRDDPSALARNLTAALALGSIFLLVQGGEWI